MSEMKCLLIDLMGPPLLACYMLGAGGLIGLATRVLLL